MNKPNHGKSLESVDSSSSPNALSEALPETPNTLARVLQNSLAYSETVKELNVMVRRLVKRYLDSIESFANHVVRVLQSYGIDLDSYKKSINLEDGGYRIEMEFHIRDVDIDTLIKNKSKIKGYIYGRQTIDIVMKRILESIQQQSQNQ